MEPVLLSFHAPGHDLNLVAQHVVRDGLPTQLSQWQKQSRAEEMVYLATCQRVLWILWGGNAAALRLGPEVKRFEGEKAWSHLLSVAAGLESANMGDREIPGQFTEALDQARRAGVAGAEAKAALEDIIREAHRLRSRLGLADGHVSVATAALKHLDEGLEAGASVAIVGVGPMSTYLAQRLPERGYRVTLVNRTLSKAEVLAGPLGVPVLPLSQLQRTPEGFDAVVTATGSPEPLFTFEQWREVPKRPLLRLLDLALPADSEHTLERLPWVHRVDLSVFLSETATARAQRVEASSKAEPLLLASVSRLQKRALDRAQKYELAGAQVRLQEAWAQLEREAMGAAALGEDQRANLEAVLRRGRTLAHRALIQSQAIELPQGISAGVPCE